MKSICPIKHIPSLALVTVFVVMILVFIDTKVARANCWRDSLGIKWCDVDVDEVIVDLTDPLRDTFDELQSSGTALGDWFQDRANTLGNSAKVEVGNAVETLKKSDWYQRFFVKPALYLFMEKPTIEWRNECNSAARPIYFVNGVLNTRSAARESATLLSKKICRPVGLIINPSMLEGHTGTPQAVDDITESIYDRVWPETLGVGASGLDAIIKSVLHLPGTSQGVPFTQLNPTTRQLTYLIYHSTEPIILVTHSQGSLIARNALLTASLLSRESWIRNNVTWIAVGAPLSDWEVWPDLKPERFQIHVNPGDPIGQIIGLRGGGQWSQPDIEKHNFQKSYLPWIEEESLLASSSLVVGCETPHPQPFIYVNGAGTNACAYGTKSNPYRRLEQGVRMSSSGGIVYVQAGLYSERLRIEKRVTLMALGGTVILKPEGPAGSFIGFSLVSELASNIDPGGGSLASHDGTVALSFPDGAVATPTQVKLTTASISSPNTEGYRFSGRAFEITAIDPSNNPIVHFEQPLTLNLHYGDADWQNAGISNENDLNIYFEDGDGWQATLPCTGCSHDMDKNEFVVVLDHLTAFALMASLPNNVPSVTNDSVTTIQGNAITIDVLANDIDPDGDALLIITIDKPKNGTVALDGSHIVYVALLGFIGQESFTYTVSDGKGGRATAIVMVDVQRSGAKIFLPVIRK